MAPTRPSIMSEGASTSAPASACTSDWRTSTSSVSSLAISPPRTQPVVAMAGVGIERDVEDDADVEARRLDGARRAAHEVLGIEGLARVLGAQLGLGVGKERDRRDAERSRLLRGGDDVVDREALDARHGGDRHALVAALDDEERPDQVVDAEPVLGDEAARPARAPRAPQAHAGKGRRGRVRRCSSRAGVSVVRPDRFQSLTLWGAASLLGIHACRPPHSPEAGALWQGAERSGKRAAEQG